MALRWNVFTNNFDYVGGGGGSGPVESVTGNNGIIVSPTTGSPNVRIENYLSGTGTSVNAAPADLVTFPLGGVAACYRFNFDIVGRDTTTGNGVGYTLQGTAKTNGTVATIIAVPFSDDDENPTLIDADISLVATANNVILRVIGVTGQTIAYKAVGKYTVV